MRSRPPVCLSSWSIAVIALLVGSGLYGADTASTGSDVHVADCSFPAGPEVNVSEVKDAGVLLILPVNTDLGWAGRVEPDTVRDNFKFESGKLQLVKPLDLETGMLQGGTNVDLYFSCDGGATVIFRVNVIPVNEFSPVFRNSPYDLTLKENTKPGTLVFTLKDKVEDGDKYMYNTIDHFSIEPYLIEEFDLRSYFSINRKNGSLFLRKALDYDTMFNYDTLHIPPLGLNVSATDSGGRRATTTVKVTIADVDDQPPVFLAPGCGKAGCRRVDYTASIGTCFVGEISAVSPAPIYARDGDSIGAGILYSLSDVDPVEVGSNIMINETTGTITVLTNFSDFLNDTTELVHYPYLIQLVIQATEDTDIRFASNSTFRISLDPASDICSSDVMTTAGITDKTATIENHPTTNPGQRLGNSSAEKDDDDTSDIIKIVVPVCAGVLLIVVVIVAIVVSRRSTKGMKYAMKDGVKSEGGYQNSIKQANETEGQKSDWNSQGAAVESLEGQNDVPVYAKVVKNKGSETLENPQADCEPVNDVTELDGYTDAHAYASVD